MNRLNFFYEKQIFLCLPTFLVALLSLMFITCKKDSSSSGDLNLLTSKNQILSYLKHLPQSDSLLNELDLTSIKHEKILNNDVVTVSLQSKTDARKAVFFQDRNRDQINHAIIYVVESENGKNFADIHFADIISHQIQDFTGTVSICNINNRLLQSYNYKVGKLTFTRKLVGKPKAIATTGSIDNESICTFWYRVDVYADGSETWTFMYATCNDGSTPAGGGGGGSGNSAQDECYNSALLSAQNLSASATVTSSYVGADVSDIDAFRKNKNPEWICLTSATFQLHSHETGVVELVDAATNKWQWVSFAHDNIVLTGYAIGGTVSSDNGKGTPSFTAGTPNVLYAGMSVQFNVTYTPLPAKCPILDVIFPPYTVPYTSNAIFNAIP